MANPFQSRADDSVGLELAHDPVRYPGAAPASTSTQPTIASAMPAMVTTAAPPTADIGVVSLHASVSHASPGARITFTEVIRNNGPQAVELDTVPQITGGTLVEEICDAGVSPDTPACEYGFVNPGTSLTTKFIVKVTASSGGHLTLKGGVTSEAPFLDTNPFNQYRTVSIPIT